MYFIYRIEKQNLVTLLLMFDCHDTHVLYQCMYMTKIHDSHTCIQLNPENDHVSHLCHSKTCVNILHLSLEPPHVNNSRLQCTL